MPTIVITLLAGQGAGRIDGESGEYLLTSLGSIKIGCVHIAAT